MNHEAPRTPVALADRRRPSVLFVDDETRILDGLKRALHARRVAWDLRFAAGGSAALEAMEQAPADLVVSDMRMPGIDGATLLAMVRERWPASIRIILSGQSDAEAGLQAVRIVHQFLNKPCDPSVLEAVIEQAVRNTHRIPDARLRARAGSLGALAARPCSRTALERILADPQANVAAALPVIATDAALAAKVLQLTGTSFFVRPHPFVDLETAVACLGVEALRTLAASHVFGSDAFPETGLGPWLEEHHARAVRAARAGRERSDEPALGGVDYLRGLFADLGSLVLASASGTAPDARSSDDRDFSSVLLGAYLLGIWGVSPTIVEAVAGDAIAGKFSADTTAGADSGGIAA
jgi:DNA-binding NarL/FixJ family response regulator